MLSIDISMVEVDAGADAVAVAEGEAIDMSILEIRSCQSRLIAIAEFEVGFEVSEWNKAEEEKMLQ